MVWSICFDICQLYSPDQLVELQFYHKKQEQQIEYFLFGTKPIHCSFKSASNRFQGRKIGASSCSIQFIYIIFQVVITSFEYNVHNLHFMAFQLTAFGFHKIVVILVIFFYLSLSLWWIKQNPQRVHFHLPLKLTLFQKRR